MTLLEEIQAFFSRPKEAFGNLDRYRRENKINSKAKQPTFKLQSILGRDR